MSNSKIPWTEHTCQISFGCSPVSEGCANCYAVRMAWRLMHMKATAERYEGTVEKVNGVLRWTGRVNVDLQYLRKATKPKKPRLIFVNSMSDIFHPSISDDVLVEAFGIMGAAKQHRFQLLTKRPERIPSLMADLEERFDFACYCYVGSGQDEHSKDYRTWQRIRDAYFAIKEGRIALGVTVENQHWADIRIKQLVEYWPGLKFVSVEPMLGPVIIDPECLSELGQVICGCESGPGARPTLLKWVQGLRDLCYANGVQFFLKQLRGRIMPVGTPSHGMTILPSDGSGKLIHKPMLDGQQWTQPLFTDIGRHT